MFSDNEDNYARGDDDGDNDSDDDYHHHHHDNDNDNTLMGQKDMFAD